MAPWAVPFLSSAETALEENDELGYDEMKELKHILKDLEKNEEVDETSTDRPNPTPNLLKRMSTDLSNRIGRFKRQSTSRTKSGVKKNKITTMKERAAQLLVQMKSKRGLEVRKEARATKLVVTVLGKGPFIFYVL